MRYTSINWVDNCKINGTPKTAVRNLRAKMRHCLRTLSQSSLTGFYNIKTNFIHTVFSCIAPEYAVVAPGAPFDHCPGDDKFSS